MPPIGPAPRLIPTAATPRGSVAPARPAPKPAAPQAPAAPAASAAKPLDTLLLVRAAVADKTDFDLAAISAAKLKPTELDKKLTGANVKFHAEDEAGNKYTFKPFKPGSTNFERDLLSYQLHRDAGEPAIPVVPQKLTMPSGQTLDGYVKPKVKGSEDLPPDVADWSTPQKGQLLADAAWAEFLGNYDLKLDQYKSIDVKDPKAKAALDTDWDCSLTDYQQDAPLSRYKAFRSGLTNSVLPPAPPAQNLLYEVYVRGKTQLDFAPMFEAVGRIEKLTDAQVREALAPFIAKQFANGGTFGKFATPEDLVQHMLQRRDGLRAELTTFKGQLDEERAYLASRQDKLLPSPREIKTWAKDTWMHLGNWFVRSPLLGMVNRISQHKDANALGIKVE